MSEKRKEGYGDYNNLQIVTFIILFVMIVSGILIIRNINSEYKTRSIAGEMQRYKYSILAFNNIYNGLPGDLDKATFYWKESTSDGDGNREIGSLLIEKVLGWQHLQLSGQLNFENRMSGKWAKEEEENSYGLGVNIPRAEKAGEKSSYILGYDDSGKRNYIKLVGVENGGVIPVLTPDEAHLIDLTIDDGYPETGNVKVFSLGEAECFFAGEYKEEGDIKECILLLNI